MCNKYKDESKAAFGEHYEIVKKCNSINFDFRRKPKNPQCQICENTCKNVEFILRDECENFSPRMTLEEINDEIRIQNINLEKLCKKNKLKEKKMNEMLKYKRPLLYKYYIALENRIMESEEYLEYIDRFEVADE